MIERDSKFGLIYLCISHSLLHAYSNLPAVLLPILINEYNLSILVIGLIVSIPKIFSLVFSIPAGILADRLSPSKLISFSLFLEASGAILIMLIPSAEIIVLGFSLTALASTFYHPSALTATTNILSSDFWSRGLGFHGASGTFGFSLGPITLGLILNWFEWRYVYLIWIIPIFSVAIIAFFMNVNIGKSTREQQRKDKDESFKTTLKSVLSITFLSFLLLLLFTSAASTTISTYFPTYLTEIKMLDVSSASIIFGISPFLGLVSSALGGYLGDKLGSKKTLLLVISISIIALFCVFLSGLIILMVLFYLCYGFFNSMRMPITTSLVPKIVPKKSRATAFSLQFIPMSLIGILMPIILAVVIYFFELWIIFPIAIILYIIALIISQTIKI